MSESEGTAQNERFGYVQRTEDVKDGGSRQEGDQKEDSWM